MGLRLYVSNSLQELSGQLAAGLKEQHAGVFQKQYIVTQTEGMNNWLTVQLAAKMGIHANCRFLKPNDIVNQLYYWLGGNNRRVLATDHLQWLIYRLLGDEVFRQRYKMIAGYYQEDDVKRIALAEKMADLFDQYQVYRPEMVDEWNTGSIGHLQENEWQRYLWIKVKEKTGADLTDKTSVMRYIIAQLGNPLQHEKLRSLVPCIHIFGISVITQLHIQLFYELSKYIAINFYLLNPAPLVYWLDDKTEKQIARMARLSKIPGKAAPVPAATGNTLLISWGKLIQETFGLLFENEDFLNVYDDSGVIEPDTEKQATLLKKIQLDIFYNNDAAARQVITVTDIRDESLTVNACYTPVREVESLYNYLVHLVDQKKERLSPKDIVVMVSDIDAYAPYIKAVFNTATYKFPHVIADERFSSGDSIFTAVEALLSLSEESFKAEEIMQLLDSTYIRQRLNITDIPLLRRATGMANIRFGIEGNTEDDTALVSWNTGLQRILYGICMSGSTAYQLSNDTIYPLDVAEGSEALELIRFAHFVELLIAYIKNRAADRTLAEWGQYIYQLADNLVFQPDTNETEEEYQRLLKYVEKLNVLTDTYNDKISFEVFKHSFLDIIAAETRSRAFASGGVTFCSLIPMRSIPFKVVALLGMDFDKFPRRETPLSFNLIEKKRRRGDRNIKDNDKHLFLETILSAREYLYISYIGRNAKDNSVHPPSALVDELVDYVESGIVESHISVRNLLIISQPLHGFSQKYFQKLPGIYSYLGNGIVPTVPDSKVFAATKEKKIFNFDEVAVGSLLSFFKDPFKWYYNTALGIYYNDAEVLLPDTELFELDKLMEWQLKKDLLRLNEDETESYRVKALKTGALPLKKHVGDIGVQDQRRDRTGKKIIGGLRWGCRRTGSANPHPFTRYGDYRAFNRNIPG